MIGRLTCVASLISLVAVTAAGQPVPRSSSGRSAQAATHSINWQHVPLGAAVERLSNVSDTAIFLDRRVDPQQRIDLTLSDATVDEILARLAAEYSLGSARLDGLCYVGPRAVAERIATLATQRRRDVAALPGELRRSLSERRRIAWSRLTEPRELVRQLMEDHGWRVVGIKRIPHDLWATGSLPAMTLSEQLTLLLAGFDRTFRIRPDEHAIEIVPVNWQSIEAAAPASAVRRQRARPLPGGRQVFTLRVENQPVGMVLDGLGWRLGWQLTVDEAAIRAAGRSLDVRVSFSVENADEDQLLDALLGPAGLQAQRDGKRVRVGPR